MDRVSAGCIGLNTFRIRNFGRVAFMKLHIFRKGSEELRYYNFKIFQNTAPIGRKRKIRILLSVSVEIHKKLLLTCP